MTEKTSIFDYSDYKEYLVQEIERRPHKGRGELLKLSKHLGVHTSMMSHVLRQNNHFTMEQGLKIAGYLGLNELETDCLIAMIHQARAGDEVTRQYCANKLKALRDKATNLSLRFQIKNKLEESDQAIYYSSWLYSAVRLLTAIPEIDEPQKIAKAVGVPVGKIYKIIDFLLSRGLVDKKNNKLVFGNVNTYVGRESPLSVKHSLNWRMKAIEKLETLDEKEFAYSHAVVLSEEAFQKVSMMIVKFIEEYQKVVGPSPSEKLCCLNIDWIQITQNLTRSE